MSVKELRSPEQAIRPLTKREIDRRIELLVTEVAALAAEEDDEFRPRWISAQELVRRLRPFITMN